MSKWKMGASCSEISKYNQKEKNLKWRENKYHLQRIFRTRELQTRVDHAPFLFNFEIITREESHDVPKETWVIWIENKKSSIIIQKKNRKMRTKP